MTVTEEAIRLVHGARQDSYGHPFDDFSRTGRLWGAILGTDPVPPHLVALCMIAVKVSREVNAPKADNLVDIAGYAEALALVREREAVTVATVTSPVSCEEMSSPPITVTSTVTSTVAGQLTAITPPFSSKPSASVSVSETDNHLAHAREGCRLCALPDDDDGVDREETA